MTALAIVWAWIKKHWRMLLAVIGTVFSVLVGIFLFKRQTSNMGDQIKAINDAHAAELKQINDARAQEEAQHLANEKKLNETLAAVQAHYDAAQKELDEKKKAEVADIVKKYGDKPDELAKQLAAATGFTVIMPTE